MLTDKVREIASKTLPSDNFILLRQDAVVEKIGAEEYFVACKEGTCIGELAKKANANYGARCDVFKVDNNLVLKFELYSVKEEAILETFTDYEAKDFSKMLAVLNESLPGAFKKMIPGGSKASPLIPGGISRVQSTGGDYEFEGGKRYLASISSDPEGATLSFDGMPNSRCKETPCNVELGEGSVRIIANLEQYEIADTTFSIRQNNQSIRIRMKANFGVLEIKPAYIDGIGSNEYWNLTLNGTAVSSWESRLSPGKYNVELSHRCYEAISFEAGINKDKREVFDMASYVKLKKGGLDLSAEADGVPIGEPVFVNGKRVGETPFSGSVPVCARIEIGEGREDVDVKIKHNESVKYTHQMNTEYRRQRLAKQEQEREKEMEKQEQERKKQEELAAVKRPWFAIGGGWANGAIRGSLFSINPEFVSIADGHLSFGADIDLGIHNFKPKEDSIPEPAGYFFRGGPSAKLSFGEYRWLYLATGASWYVDEAHSGPSFSVGGGVRGLLGIFMFIDAQYSIMPMNNRNASYWAIRGGLSFPYSRWRVFLFPRVWRG